MPSQEDYLDNLLKGLNAPKEDEAEAQVVANANADMNSELNLHDTTTDSTEELMDFTGVEIDEFKETGDAGKTIIVEDTIEMTEDEIERLLSETQEAAEESLIDSAENIPEDVMDILNQEDDSELQEIHDLLQKSDNNEAIDDEIMTSLQETPDEEVDLLENIMSEDDDVTEELLFDEKAKKAAERKREQDEKRAEKLALREAKKAARLEAKSIKEAEKRAKKEALAEAKRLRQEQKQEETQETEVMMESEQEYEEPKEITLGQDELADLDVLLNMAENAMMSSDSEKNEENSAGGDDFFAAFSADEIKKTEPVQEISQDSFSADAMVEKVVADKQKSKKKKMISRLLDMLTEEEEEEDSKDNENIQLSDENQDIIEELDKGKKKKGKKDKKSKKAQEGENGAEGEEDGADEDKKGKKPKKERKPKKEEIPQDLIEQKNTSNGGGKLSFKRILPIMLICISLVVIIILVANLAGDYSAKHAGREAYYNGDYQTCYQNLYGKELNESEQVMYSKSESILRIRLWIREYEMLVEEGAEAEALDSLIQSVDDYPALYEYASQWTAESEVAELYAQILSILSGKYQLTEAQALEIASVEDDVEYSAMIYAIADGKEFGSWNQQEQSEPEILEDVLPEEEELGEIPFVDNNGN